MAKIKVDIQYSKGKIKPMHAVNNGPVNGPGVAECEYLKEAGIPYARVHDTGGAFGANVYVDIENIFRNFDADSDDPASYDFSFTDWLFAEYEKNGTKPFYRLGTTIENSQAIKAYRIFPPKDNLKWAQICEHIILHYNEGWANGFHYDIEYWEIWNEPDNQPKIEDNPMWKGTKEQFFELYVTAANYLKNKFPNLKIGGYGSCGFYAIATVAVNPEAHISERSEYFVEFFHDFLKYISDEKHTAPLDFFSWHSYADLEANIIFSNYVRETLDQYGFTHTEHLCDEWNPGLLLRGKLRDATNIAKNFIALHHTSLSMAMFYDWQPATPYCAVFNPMNNKPFKAFYVFKAFNELYKKGQEIQAISDNEKIYVLAAKDKEGCALLLVNDSDKSQKIELSISGCDLSEAELSVIDEFHNYEKSEINNLKTGCFTIEKDAVILLKVPYYR